MIEIVPRNLYDDIEYLTGLGISIIPLKSVKKETKSKDDYKKGLVANWTNQITSFTELQESLKEGIVGYAIQTGQKSQIFVIDWDNKDINDKSNDFKQKLIDCNTLTINTAGKGHHFIFKYQGKLSTIKNHTHLFGNIDIRNNQGCIYFGDRDDGIYSINRTKIDYEDGDTELKIASIRELPDNLLLELQDEIINKTGKKIKDKSDKYKKAVEENDEETIKELTARKYQNGEYVIGIERYFITPEHTKKLLELLTEQDEGYLEDYSKWFIITIILKKLHTGRDNDFKKVWREWSNKSKKYDMDNNKNIWNWIEPDEYDVNVNYIIAILNTNLNKDVKNKKDWKKIPQIEKIIYDYKPLTDEDVRLWIRPKSSVSVINNRYLPSSLYQNANHLDIIKSGLGTGKTYSTFKYSIENNTPLIVISHLTSLVSNQTSTYNNLVEKDYINTELDNILKNYEKCENYNQYRYIFKTDLYDVKRVNINKPEDIDITKPIKPEKGDIVYIVYDINTKLEIERMSVSKYHKLRSIYDKEYKKILSTINKLPKQMLSYEDIKNTSDIGEQNSIATTINSLIKTTDKIRYSDCGGYSNYVLYVDEAHRIIHNLFTNSTIDSQKKNVIQRFYKLIKECKKVIFTDGDYDDLTFQFISSIKIPFNYIENIKKSYEGIDVVYLDNDDIMYSKMIELIKENKYFTICCNRKGDVNSIKTYLLQYGVNPEDILVYTSDEGVDVKDANKEWCYKIKIYSPSIVEGVDYTAPSPEVVFVFVGTDKSINCEQIKQQICRNRNIEIVYICFNKLDNNKSYDTEEELYLNVNKKRKIFNLENERFYQRLQDFQQEIWDNEQHIFTRKDSEITKMYIKSVWLDLKHKTNMKYTIARLLEGLGFTIRYDMIENYNKLKEIIDPNKDKEKHIYNNTEIKLWNGDKGNIIIEGNNQSHLWNWLKGDTSNIKFINKLENRLKYMKISKDLIIKICYYDKDIIKKIASSLKDTDLELVEECEDENDYYNKYYDKLKGLIQNVFTNEIVNKRYSTFRKFIKTDENLMRMINIQQGQSLNITNADMEEYKIIVYKELMRKYFPKLNIYRLEYYDIDYKDKIINLSKEELNKLNSVYSGKSLDKTEIKEKELLKRLTTLIGKVMGMGFINKPTREASGINGVKKQLNTNIESVNSNLILLLLGGQSLNYDNIEDEVKQIKFRDIDVGQQKHQFIDEDDYD
jgi:hypothetical protein